MIEVVRYQKEEKNLWNQFIRESRKSVFLFYREYMDYHSHVFTDHSLMFFKKSKLIAVLPANQKDCELHSHQGLTYGGVITLVSDAKEMIQIIDVLLAYLKKEKFKTIFYKMQPSIFQSSFQENDLYAIFRRGFKLSRRDLSFVIDLQNEIKYSKDRRYRINKSKRNNLTIEESKDFEKFMSIVNANLTAKFNITAVHSASEIKLLAQEFPENIKLYVVKDEESNILGGSIMFVDNDFIHTQYLHSNFKGKKLNAIEFLIDSVIVNNKTKKYLSFGTSTENNGIHLNEGLASFKESFGANGVLHDFYKLEIGD